MKNRYLKKIMITSAMTAAVLLTGICVEAVEKETEIQSEMESETELPEELKALIGTYEGTKTIEAMNCDITVRVTLEEDGTYTYYRAPMLISMGEESEMPELEDAGTYEVAEQEITFTGEELGEFTVLIDTEEELWSLEGKIPTGGPSTELSLEKVEETEEIESEGMTEEMTETEK